MFANNFNTTYFLSSLNWLPSTNSMNMKHLGNSCVNQLFMPISRSVYSVSGKYLIGISLNSGKLCENSAKKQIEKKWISKWWDPDALGSQLCCYRKIQRIGMVGLPSFHHWMTKLISFSYNWKSKTYPKNLDSIAPSVGTS